MEKLTEDRLKDIRARDAARTQGRWGIRREELDEDFSDEEQDMAMVEAIGPFEIAGHDSLYSAPPDHERIEADVAWVDHLSEDVPLLLVEIDRLRAENAKLRKA